MTRRLWLIAYDIADDERRSDVEAHLLAMGERVQYSVFECYLSQQRLETLIRQLTQAIDPKEDNIRAWPLCTWCAEKVSWQGQGRRPDDQPYYQI